MRHTNHHSNFYTNFGACISFLIVIVMLVLFGYYVQVMIGLSQITSQQASTLVASPVYPIGPGNGFTFGYKIMNKSNGADIEDPSYVQTYLRRYNRVWNNQVPSENYTLIDTGRCN